jgi:hypothetical protein
MREQSRSIEIWRQDPDNADLWHAAHGVIINTSALNEREAYFEIVRLQYYSAAKGQPLPHVVS